MSSSPEDVPSCTMGTLAKLLSETLLPDQGKREAAQEGIKAVEVTEKFGVHLAEILVQPEGELEVRQLASTALQRYIETHWRNSFNEVFELPEINLESKEKIKEILPLGLRELTIEIRTAIAQTISTIAYWNWPEDWPGLYDVLVDCLSGESDYAVDEVIQVLGVCIRHIGNTQLPNIGSVILQAMYQIFQSEAQYPVPTKSQAVEIFTTILSFLATPDYCGSNFIRQSILPVIPMFCEKFLHALKDRSESTSNDRLKTEVVKAITMLTATLPKCILDFLPQVMPLIWEILAHRAKAYQEHTVDAEEDIDPEDVDSIEEEIDDCDSLINAIFEFIGVLISGRNGCIPIVSEYDLSNYQWFYLQDSLPPDAIQHLIIFMRLTDEQINLWTNYPSQFLIEAEMELTPCNIRSAARDLLIKIVDQNRAAAHAFVILILKHIQAENALQVSGDSRVSCNAWKSHEALLLAFSIARNIIVEKQKAKMLEFDVTVYLEKVVLADLNNAESHPLLVSRCLRLGELCAEQVSPESGSRFLKAIVNGLENRSPCVKISAALAARCWIRRASTEENTVNVNLLKSQFPAMFQGLFNLGRELMTPEGLALVLESSTLLISLDKTFMASVESQICTLTIPTFHNFYNDLSILRACETIFKELSLQSECIVPLLVRLVPELVEMLRVNLSAKVALDVVESLIEHSPQPLNSLLIESAFPASCNCIFKSDDQAILQSGGKVLRAYVSVAFQQVIGYRDSENKTGLQYISQVAAKLLKPQSSDFRIEDACEIIKSLIIKLGNEQNVDVNIQELLILVLRKMQSTERKISRSKLSMVFALIIHTQLDIFLEFLSAVPECEGRSTFAFIVADGLCKEHRFFAPDDRKIVNLALSKVLQHGVALHISQLQRDAAQGTGTEDNARTTNTLLQICNLVANELS